MDTLTQSAIKVMDVPAESIPIIDFGEYNINTNKASISNRSLDALSRKVVGEFEKVGFCYLINHGIPDEFIQRYMAVCHRFFNLPTVEKKLYERLSKESYHGWIGPCEESLDTKSPGDLKETFNYHPGEAPSIWPPNIAEFQSMNQTMFTYCHQLGNQLCEVLAVGLGLNRDGFADMHKFIGHRNNSTALRSLYYPPLGDNPRLEPGQTRLGEHSDYGTFTILFQDDVGGLEVKCPDSGFVPATPIAGAVLVNIGDMMQRMTSDRLIATRHRVRIPETEVKRNAPRQSVAFFINPDDDVMIGCLDGSNKYEPIRSVDYLNYKIRLANMN